MTCIMINKGVDYRTFNNLSNVFFSSLKSIANLVLLGDEAEAARNIPCAG